jgi:hypothetical protein
VRVADVKTVQIGAGGWSHCHDEKPRRKIKDVNSRIFTGDQNSEQIQLVQFWNVIINLLDYQLATVIAELKN